MYLKEKRLHIERGDGFMDNKKNSEKQKLFESLKKDIIKLSLFENKKNMDKLNKIPLNTQEVDNNGKRRT